MFLFHHLKSLSLAEEEQVLVNKVATVLVWVVIETEQTLQLKKYGILYSYVILCF